MTFAYADPPYLGCARRHYRKYHTKAHLWDDPATYQDLLERLQREYPDGWALSASMTSLWDLLPMIPKAWGCRIAAWCSPFGMLSARNWPRRCWEPVIWRGGRCRSRDDPPPPDFVVCNKGFASPGHVGGNQHMPRRSGYPGTKPDEFCYWLFELLNMREGDELVDLFPGTGRVTRAWETWRRAGMALFAEAAP